MAPRAFQKLAHKKKPPQKEKALKELVSVGSNNRNIQILEVPSNLLSKTVIWQAHKEATFVDQLAGKL